MSRRESCRMKYNWDKMNEEQKIKAFIDESDLATHNGTTKDDLINILKWIRNKIEIVSESEVS